MTSHGEVPGGILYEPFNEQASKCWVPERIVSPELPSLRLFTAILLKETVYVNRMLKEVSERVEVSFGLFKNE
jgi:hypothetical protein